MLEWSATRPGGPLTDEAVRVAAGPVLKIWVEEADDQNQVLFETALVLGHRLDDTYRQMAELREAWSRLSRGASNAVAAARPGHRTGP